MTDPNTFIVGAPKCGTTTVAHYLNCHPAAFVCEPKEPNFWSFDHAGNVDFNGLNFSNEREYLRLFTNAEKKGARVVCDASTSYIWSEEAIQNIYRRFPNARFILMLRHPAELCVSLYLEEKHSFAEDQKDFWSAWNLQEVRARGSSIPKECKEPKKLQYKRIASVGSHATKLIALIPPEQRKIVLLDDLRSDPRTVWRGIQEFLGLPDDGRDDFPVINAAKDHRFPRLAKSVLRPHPLLTPVVNVLRTVAWTTGLKGARSGILKLLSRAPDRNKKGEVEIIRDLLPEFEDEIALLERAVVRDLAYWRAKYG